MRNSAEARQHVANKIPQMNATMVSKVQFVKETIQHMPKYVKNGKKKDFNHQT